MGREVLAFEWEEEDRMCSNFFCIKTFLTPLSEQVRFFDPPPISNPSSWPLPKVSVLLRLALFNKQKDKRRELTLKYNQRGSFRLNLQASIYKGAENYVPFNTLPIYKVTLVASVFTRAGLAFGSALVYCQRGALAPPPPEWSCYQKRTIIYRIKKLTRIFSLSRCLRDSFYGKSKIIIRDDISITQNIVFNVDLGKAI